MYMVSIYGHFNLIKNYLKLQKMRIFYTQICIQIFCVDTRTHTHTPHEMCYFAEHYATNKDP